MKALPRLTVGLPVYNGENYLAESLDALLGQSYADFELIISDNASTDGTADICRQYEKKDARVRYFRQPQNVGLAPNHNFVVEQARGELFKWASHDDLYARDLLEPLRGGARRAPGRRAGPLLDRDDRRLGRGDEAIEYPLATASPPRPSASGACSSTTAVTTTAE